MKFFSKRTKLALAILAVSLLAGAAALAQQQNQQAQVASPPQQQMVKLNVLVIDEKKNQAVADLRQEDFQVFEGDAPQTISFFSKEAVPASYGLLVDNSGSLRSQFQNVIETGKIIVNGNKPDDESFLVRFISTDKITLAHDFTTDKIVLTDRLNSFQVEGGQTALIDALYNSATHLMKRKPEEDAAQRLRALIVVTDGEDRGSTVKKGELIKLLRQTNIQVFVVGLVKELDAEGGLIGPSRREKSVSLLEEIAKETGGRAFFPASPAKLFAVASEITSYLHTQYILGYSRPAKADKNGPRKVRVKLQSAPGRDKLKVMTRAGSTAP